MEFFWEKTVLNRGIALFSAGCKLPGIPVPRWTYIGHGATPRTIYIPYFDQMAWIKIDFLCAITLMTRNTELF